MFDANEAEELRNTRDRAVLCFSEMRRPKPRAGFAGTTFDGRKLALSGVRGRLVSVNFFASWCTSCERVPPVIPQEYLAHEDQGFTVLGVNTLENGHGPRFYHGLALTAATIQAEPNHIG